MSSSNQTAKVDRIWQLSADALPGVTLVATIFGGASLIAHQTQAHMDTKLESLKSNLDSKLNASLSNMDTKLEANLTNTITKLDANLTNTNTKLDQTAKRMEAYVEKAAALQAATYMVRMQRHNFLLLMLLTLHKSSAELDH